MVLVLYYVALQCSLVLSLSDLIYLQLGTYAHAAHSFPTAL